jgi:hypothetical protein
MRAPNRVQLALSTFFLFSETVGYDTAQDLRMSIVENAPVLFEAGLD